MISAAILCGIAGSCLFAAQCLYIAVIGLRYSQLNIEGQNVVIVRFFGYFFMIVHMGQVFGNLVSSLLLTSLISHSPLENRVDER